MELKKQKVFARNGFIWLLIWQLAMCFEQRFPQTAWNFWASRGFIFSRTTTLNWLVEEIKVSEYPPDSSSLGYGPLADLCSCGNKPSNVIQQNTSWPTCSLKWLELSAPWKLLIISGYKIHIYAIKPMYIIYENINTLYLHFKGNPNP